MNPACRSKIKVGCKCSVDLVRCEAEVLQQVAVPFLPASHVFLPRKPVFHFVHGRLLQRPAKSAIDITHDLNGVTDQIDIGNVDPTVLEFRMG